MLTIEEVQAMSRKELFQKEEELLNKLEMFPEGSSENNKWREEIYNDYVLVSDEADKIHDAELDEEDLKAIDAYAKAFEYALLGPDPAKTRRGMFKKV